jgi:hypothetical protein
MPSFRHDVSRTAQDLSRVAQDAAYVAVGLGVVGFQKAQVARRDLMQQLERQRRGAERPLAEVKGQLAKTWNDVDAAVGQLIEVTDSTLEPLAERLPAQARDAVKQLQGTRDRVRSYLKGRLEAA